MVQAKHVICLTIFLYEDKLTQQIVNCLYIGKNFWECTPWGFRPDYISIAIL